MGKHTLQPWSWPVVAVLLGSLVVSLSGVSALNARRWEPLLIGLLLGCLLLISIGMWAARRRRESLRRLTAALVRLVDEPSDPLRPIDDPELSDVEAVLQVVRLKLQRAALIEPDSGLDTLSLSGDDVRDPPRPPAPPMTRSGLYDAPMLATSNVGDPSAREMISRLDPRELRWIDSSLAEQEFLGWPLSALREKSFLEVVHPDHRDLAREQLLGAVARGEAHGLVYRVKTAQGETKAVQMNVGARYGSDMNVSHLRCHLTDITAKLRADRELRRRTRELTSANEQLRAINRELHELKERYFDLYENSPAMYLSLDAQGIFRECNDTLLRTLGYRRSDLIGRSYLNLLPESRHALFAERNAELVRTGYVEAENRWIKADGSTIDVWFRATAVRSPDGTYLHSRGVAQDVTARKALEAELHEKNERLARTIDELSRRNRELDSFTHVVSHDLSEPLRTILGFSEFLRRDQGQRLDAEGREHLGYLVEAARRMRSLIHDLLALARAGRAAGDFEAVAFHDLLTVVQADLAESIRARGAEVRVAADLPVLWGDPVRLGQLFGNLIANALKYNRQATPLVEVGRVNDQADDRATVFVRDNGIGIDPRDHAKIFQVFRRLHARDEYDGTGAGLAICQKIAQAHGGRIWVESQPGQGSTFFVSLPTSASAAPAPPRTEVLQTP